MCLTVHEFCASDGYLPWRRNLLKAFSAYRISATVLVPSSYAESPIGSSTSPPFALCVSSCVPLIAHSDLFPSHTEVCVPFQTLAVFAASLHNFPQPSPVCSAAFDPHDSCLQLHLFTMCQDGGNFVCQQHLRQQEFLTILGSLLC